MIKLSSKQAEVARAAHNAALRYGDPDPVGFAAQMMQESSLDPSKHNGVANILPATEKMLGGNRFDPQSAFQMALKYRAQIRGRNDVKNEAQVLWGYNQGPGNAHKNGRAGIGDPNYVGNIQRHLPYVAAAIGRSRQRAGYGDELSGVNSALAAVQQRANDIFRRQYGVGIQVRDGMRTIDEQREYVRKGASKTMNSRHLNGNALDLTVDYGKKRNDKQDWDYAHKINGAMMQASKELGIPVEWGGNWKSFRDGFHWQLPHSYKGGKSQPMQLASSEYGGTMTDTPPRDEDFSDIFGQWQPSNRFAAPKSEQKPNVPDSEVADIFGQSWQPSSRYAAPKPADENAVVAPATGGFNPNPLSKREEKTTADMPKRDFLVDVAMGGYRGLKDVGAGLVSMNESLSSVNPLANIPLVGKYREQAAQYVDEANRADLARYKEGGYDKSGAASYGRFAGNVLPMSIPGMQGIRAESLIPKIANAGTVGAVQNMIIGSGRSPDEDKRKLAAQGALFGIGGSAVGGVVGKGVARMAGAATGAGKAASDTAIKRLLDASAPGMDDFAAAARLRGAMQSGNTTLVPGAAPTVPQAAMLPGVSQVRRDINNFGANALQDKEAIQEAARIAALQGIKDTTGLTAQDAAQAAGQQIGSQLRGAHQAAKAETSALYKTPELQNATLDVSGNRAQSIYDDFYKVAGGDVGADPIIKEAVTALGRAQQLPFGELQRLRSRLSAVSADYGKDNTARAAAGAITKDIDNILETLPAFAPAKAARAQQGDLYESGIVGKITGKKSGGDYGLDDDAITRSLLSTAPGQTARIQQFGAVADNQSLDAAQTAFMADLMERSGRNIGTDAQKILSNQLDNYTKKRSGTVGELFSGEQRQVLSNVVEDAKRATAAGGLGIGAGSNTIQNLHGALNLGLLDNKLLNSIGAVGGKVPLVGDVAKAAVDGIKNSQRQKLANELATLLSDPKLTDEALAAYLRSIRGGQVGGTAGLLGAIGAGQGASGR